MTTRTPAFSRVLYCVPIVDNEGNAIAPGGATNTAAANDGVLAGNTAIADTPYTNAANANGISNFHPHFYGVDRPITLAEYSDADDGSTASGIDHGNGAANNTGNRAQCEEMVGTDTGNSNRQIGITVYGN